MKHLYIILLLVLNLFAGEIIPDAENPQIMLQNISKDAIRIGDGDDKIVYLFVDPMCKFSRRIIKLINNNKMLQLANSYYVFLYRLEKFDSEKLIQYIYQSEDRKTTLLDVMVDGEIIDLDDFEASEKTIKTVQDISDVGKKLNITLRPYMISFEKNSKYCIVSEGEASCMEEFDN